MIKESNGSAASKSKSVASCTLVYIFAAGVAVGVGYALGSKHPILIAGVADLVAMIIVFCFSVAFNNSSLYDPYWSVAPIPIALFWMLKPLSTDVDVIRQVVVLTLLSLWSLRLTYNWLCRWKGFSHEDWRYLDFREKSGRSYWLVSFFGIHLFPTGIVFMGCLSLYAALSSGTNHFGALDCLAVAVTAAAIWIEARADQQLRRFVTTKENEGKTLSTGLWAHSRHPNYFGEVLF